MNPNEVRPAHLRAEDVAPVTIILPMWEARKVLTAVRARRRAKVRQAEQSDRTRDFGPGFLNARAVEAAALSRAEEVIAAACGVEVTP